MSGTRSHVSCLPLAFLLCAGLPAIPTAAQAGQYGKLPLVFEPNVGQFDSRVRYAARRGGSTLFLTDTEILIAAPGGSVGVEFVGGHVPRKIDASELQPGVSNYLFGKDPSRWKTNVPHCSRVRYQDVYPGIDVVFYANGADLEYDLMVKPGADPSAIHFAWHGTDSLRLDGGGDVVASVGVRDIRLRKPVVFQEKREVLGWYEIVAATGQVNLKLGHYDRSRPIIVDPVLSLTYSTYLGGSLSDQVTGIAVDSFGSAYVTGTANSIDFPLASPLQATNHGAPDIFVSKLDPAGSALVYSTYLGGSGADSGAGIAVDPYGNAYVTGTTASVDFPVMNPLQGALAGGDERVRAQVEQHRQRAALCDVPGRNRQ
jgi:hypothetical protein